MTIPRTATPTDPAATTVSAPTPSARAARQAEVVQALLQSLPADALLWHSEHRVLLNGHKTVVFR